jgi:hypothetical protein
LLNGVTAAYQFLALMAQVRILVQQRSPLNPLKGGPEEVEKNNDETRLINRVHSSWIMG